MLNPTESNSNSVDREELERYLRIYQQNSSSRVFAPLADLYRRLGRLGEAEEICREGIKKNPYYAGGKVALAHVLLDAHRFEEARVEAENVVTFYPDNLLARKILVKILGGLGETQLARKEFETLKGLAPQIASDPELERSLQGPQKNETLLASPLRGRPPPPINRRLAKTSHDFNTLGPDKNEDTRQSRSERLHRILRKKVLLETWLRMLGSAPSLR
jgi:tetratricopeptide (TPR) repeat protein